MKYYAMKFHYTGGASDACTTVSTQLLCWRKEEIRSWHWDGHLWHTLLYSRFH